MKCACRQKKAGGRKKVMSHRKEKDKLRSSHAIFKVGLHTILKGRIIIIKSNQNSSYLVNVLWYYYILHLCLSQLLLFSLPNPSECNKKASTSVLDRDSVRKKSMLHAKRGRNCYYPTPPSLLASDWTPKGKRGGPSYSDCTRRWVVMQRRLSRLPGLYIYVLY